MKNQMVLTLCALLSSCAFHAGPQKSEQAERYRCENDIAFTVKFANDSATINSNRGYEVLYRTAGGLTASQTVFVNPRIRAEFGLGATGREAMLRYLLQPVVVRCIRD